jgi:hypothetical protein
MSGTAGRSAPTAGHEFEVRGYIDGWLHLYRRDELRADGPTVTPRCAEVVPFHPVDHERQLLRPPVARVEVHPDCLAAGPVVPGPRPVHMAPAGAIRGRL